MNIILSIKPKWAEKIYSGEKTIEWRKTFPLRANIGSKVFLYETAPVKKITGYFIFDGQCLFRPKDQYNDQYLEPVVEKGCVPLEDLRKYADKYIFGWYVKYPRKFDTPKSLEDFGPKCPPQSWCYTALR